MCMAIFSGWKQRFRKHRNKPINIQDDNSQLKNGVVDEVESKAGENHSANATPERSDAPDPSQHEVQQPTAAIAEETGVQSQGVEARDHASPSAMLHEHLHDRTPRRSLAALSDETDTTNSSVHRAWSETSLSKALKRELPPQTGKGKVSATFSINPQLTCSTFVSVNLKSLPVETMTVAWLEHGQYKIVKDLIYRQAKHFLIQEYGDDPRVNFSRTEGYMRLMRLVKNGPDVEVRREEMLSEAYWAHYLPLMVGGFCSENEQEKVRLEVHLTFVIVSIFDRPEKTLAGKVWQVVEERMQKNWKDELFLAKTWISPIFTEEIVHKLIDGDLKLPATYGLTYAAKKKFVDYVWHFAQRLLAICVYTNTPLTNLYQLYLTKVQDQDLPLSQIPADATKYEFVSFFREQKRFHVFTFEASKDGEIVNCENVSEQATIPIINPTLLGQGAFGMVYKVSIHPRHHKFKQTEFALKCLKSETVQASHEYEQEKSILTKLAELNHHAVTIPLAMWKQGKQCCMLFPLAQSNLKVYLRNTPRPTLTKVFVLRLIEEIICLADALHSIHFVKPSDLIAPGATESLSPDTASAQRHRTGYHHDLKPENILIFPGKSEPHIWKIADFGTARIHSAVSGGRSHLERHLTAGDPDYSAPDWNIPELKATSRPYDIWSFGCILLEVLIWIFDQSPDRLDQFTIDRFRDAHQFAAFWTWRGNQIVHCPSVLQRLDMLRQETRTFAPFGKLVDVAAAALQINPKDRPDALRLLGELEIIQMQVRLNLRVNPDFYTSAGNPQIPFASFPSTMLDDSNSNDSRSLELAISRRPSAPNLQVPDSPHTPRPRSASVDSRRSRRSTDSAVGRQRSDITGMGALMHDAPTPPQHGRSHSNPQIVLNNDASVLT